MREYVWRWELSPYEAFRGHTFWSPPAVVGIEVEAAPFRAGERSGLNGLTLLFGVSDATCTIDVQGMRAAQPDLPISGDRRSGVMFVDGGVPVASYIVGGARTQELHRIAVRHDYRGRGLAKGLILEWYKRTKRPRDLSAQLLNVLGARAFLAGQREVYAWAVSQGRQVPERVLREMETHEEEARMLDVIERVERTKQRVTFGG